MTVIRTRVRCLSFLFYSLSAWVRISLCGIWEMDGETGSGSNSEAELREELKEVR